MDIHKIVGMVQAAKPAQQRRPEKDGAFADVLDKTLNGVRHEGGSAEAPLPVCGVVSMAGCNASSVDSHTVQRASSVLNLMEKYAQALRDPKRTLKSIEPIVRQIGTEIQGLKVQGREQDAGFSKLVNDIAVTATVETLKFQRGDYVA
jgi:hypothetical protein